MHCSRCASGRLSRRRGSAGAGSKALRASARGACRKAARASSWPCRQSARPAEGQAGGRRQRVVAAGRPAPPRGEKGVNTGGSCCTKRATAWVQQAAVPAGFTARPAAPARSPQPAPQGRTAWHSTAGADGTGQGGSTLGAGPGHTSSGSRFAAALGAGHGWRTTAGCTGGAGPMRANPPGLGAAASGRHSTGQQLVRAVGQGGVQSGLVVQAQVIAEPEITGSWASPRVARLASGTSAALGQTSPDFQIASAQTFCAMQRAGRRLRQGFCGRCGLWCMAQTPGFAVDRARWQRGPLPPRRSRREPRLSRRRRGFAHLRVWRASACTLALAARVAAARSTSWSGRSSGPAARRSALARRPACARAPQQPGVGTWRRWAASGAQTPSGSWSCCLMGL